MSKKVTPPKYIDIHSIQHMLKYILNNDKRPNYIQLIPKPRDVTVIWYRGNEDVCSVDNRLNVSHFNENVSINQLYHRFIYDTDGDVNVCLSNYIDKLIEHQSINHMFSYSEYIKSATLFDSKIFNTYSRANKITDYKCVAMDCEMYETVVGDEIGRISIVDWDGVVIYDQYYATDNEIIDYRTKYSGLTKEIIDTHGIKFDISHVLDIIGTNTVLVGHGLDNDLKTLQLYHDKIIDTSYLFINSEGYKVNLSILCRKYLDYEIQKGVHDSVDDALCCMRLLHKRLKCLYNFLYGDNKLMLNGSVNFIETNKLEDINKTTGYRIILFDKDNNKHIAFVPKIVKHTKHKYKHNK